MKTEGNYLPAEWVSQSGVQLTWPDCETDWCSIMDEVVPVYEQMAREILKREKLLLVCLDKKLLPEFLQEANDRLLIYVV